MTLTIDSLLENWQDNLFALYVLAWIIAAALSFAVGANDCANSFGTAVGSKTLSLRWAMVLGSIFETIGAIWMSAAVGNTIRKGIFDATEYRSFSDFTFKDTSYTVTGDKMNYTSQCANNTQRIANKFTDVDYFIDEVYCPTLANESNQNCTWPYRMNPKVTIGCDYNGTPSYPIDTPTLQYSKTRPELQLVYIHFSSMVASAMWQLFATKFSLPVSGTHSIIGALIGGALAASGPGGIQWSQLAKIGVSWITSPLLAAAMSFSIYTLIGKNILEGQDPVRSVRRAFPVFFTIIIFFNMFVLLKIQYSSKDFILRVKELPFPHTDNKMVNYRNPACVAAPISILLGLLVQIFYMPYLKKFDEEERRVKFKERTEQSQYTEINAALSEPSSAVIQAASPVKIPLKGSVSEGARNKVTASEGRKTSIKQVGRFSISTTDDLGLRKAVPKAVCIHTVQAQILQRPYFQRSLMDIQSLRNSYTLPTKNGFDSNSFEVKGSGIAADINSSKGAKLGYFRAFTKQAPRKRHVSDSVTHNPNLALASTPPTSAAGSVSNLGSSGNMVLSKFNVPGPLLKKIDESDTDEDMPMIINDLGDNNNNMENNNNKMAQPVFQVGAKESPEVIHLRRLEKSDSCDNPVQVSGMDAPTTNDIVENYFKRLQILAACCSALAHGGNDTANAIAPLAGTYSLYTYGPTLDDKRSDWLFAYGGLFMSIGLVTLGRRCIRTIGESLTKVIPSSGFTTSMVAVIVVQMSTVLGLPVSSTHCGVGAVIGIGLIDGWSNVKWSLMKNVAIAWIVTVPSTLILTFCLVKFMTYLHIGL